MVRALIDQGSQATFISEDCVQRLKLKRQRVHATVTGLGNNEAGIVHNIVQIHIKPRFASSFSLHINALVLPRLTKLLPNDQLRPVECGHIRDLTLADPTYERPGPIDVILGADAFTEIIMNGVIKGQFGTPTAQRTELGWILSGRIKNNVQQRNVISLITLTDIERQLKMFWEIEEISIKKPLTIDELDCENYYKKTHKRLKSGRYEVRIPFKSEQSKDIYSLGNSIDKAMARLLAMERKFEKDKQFEKGYKEFIREYIDLGHMTLSSNNSSENKFYLPHHAVFKHDSTTTKLRVVFDGSATSTSNVCLNDLMVAGPQIQQELSAILLRWRKHKIAYTADIEKMYRQIQVAKEDQPYQAILWRNSPSEPVSEYNLTTVTYGTRSAPFLAIRTLKQLAEDDKLKYPIGSKIVSTDFYVDDLLSGCDSIEEAQRAQREIQSLLQGGGFKIRKWASNSREFMKGIPEENRAEIPPQLNIHETIKALGIHWQPNTDSFEFKIDLPNTDVITKRAILSGVSKLYDPLGLLAPIIVEAKLIIQDLWITGLQWDEAIPHTLKRRWIKFREELPLIEHIKIPRWIQYSQGCRRFEIHGFCDASEKAYAAVVYARIITNTNNVKSTVLTAKTKVAPITNRISLPRLELCGALLLAQLMQRVNEYIDIECSEFYAWTDSNIVLAWLQGHPNKWNTFVANRVAQIKSVNISIRWHHVKSKQNPADYASRGVSPANLQSLTEWWCGPSWLMNYELPLKQEINAQTTLEMRETNSFHITTVSKPTEHDLITRFSNIRRLTRVIAYCRRFAKNSRTSKDKRCTSFLTLEEINESRTVILQIVQGCAFHRELKELKRYGYIKTSKDLTTLDPFLDENNILRVGGRLQNSNLSYDERHPAILPHKGHFTTLIIDEAHQNTLHGGCNLTWSYIRQKYWIIKGQGVVKQHIHKCLVCFRFKAKTRAQLMGMLPKPRVTITRPFTNSGVDYAGPIEIKLSRGRGCKYQKAYIVIFICLAVKAVHIEIASDLTAQAFLAAFKRFVGRRGNIENLYSDNATNFVLANKILQQNDKEAFETYKSEICKELAFVGTQWHFIPPSSPHFGGLWEAGVKSIKFHLKRTIGEHKLTYEELSTVLVQIEACLNSRPLCPLSNDPQDLEVLTPGHFLTGAALIAPITPNVQQNNVNILTRWELLNRLHQDFWRKWSKEYLLRLQQRPKWTKRTTNIEVGNLVLIRDEQLPPTKWALARVTETHEGNDGLVRVVTVRTKNTTLKRPIHKLSLLPIPDNDRYVEKETTQESSTVTNMFNTFSVKNDYSAFVTDHDNQSIHPHKKNDEISDLLFRELQQKRGTRRSKIKIRSVSGYPNLVSKEKQLEAFQTMNKRKRAHLEGEERAKIARRNDSPTASTTKFTFVPSGLCLFILALFLPLILADSGKPPAVEIQKFENHPGIFFENIGEANLISNEWNLVVYYDLSNFWKEFIGIKESIAKLENLCAHIIERRRYCELVLDQFNHYLERLQNVNDLLHNQGNSMQESFKSRKRRSPLDIVGTVSNKLFGILDQEFARHYEEQIENIKANEDHLLTLLRNQTSILEATTNIIGKSEEIINAQFKHIEEAIHQESQNMKVTQAFTTITSYTTLIIMNYEKIQNILLDVITDVHQGRINPLLLTPVQLKNQLHVIQEYISSSLEIPGRNGQDLLQIYKLITARLRITEQYALFDLRIPLYNKDTYQLFKLTPVPTPHMNEFLFIEPSTDYLAITLHRDYYYQLTEQDFKTCTSFEYDKFICPQRHPIFSSSSNSSKCEVELLNHNNHISTFCNIRRVAPSNFWIQLYHANEWIYVLVNRTTLNIICSNRLQTISIEGDGLLKLRPDCSVRHSTMIINSRQTFSSSFNSSFSPSINISAVTSGDNTNIMEGNTKHLFSPSSKQILEIQNQIKGLMTQENFPTKLNSHDIHQYAVSYVAISVLTIGSCYLIYQRWKHYKGRLPRDPSQPVPAPRRRSNDFMVNVNLRGEDDVESDKIKTIH